MAKSPKSKGSKEIAAENKPWRPAARRQMRRSSRKELTGRNGTDDSSFNYRWEHVTSVVALAKRLAELTGADPEIVEAAAWLHDIRKYKAGEDHPDEGAKYARKFLKSTDFPPKKIDAVAEAISGHMGLWRDEPLESLEAQVLWDADKLAKLGLTALMHWNGRALSGSKERTTKELLKRGRSTRWQKKTVASMHTKPARKAAKARLKAYNKFWKQLDAELSGEDLT